MGITPFATGLNRRTISFMIGKAMNRRTIQTTLAIILAIGSTLGALPAAFAQGFSTYGPYPATPGSWTGSVAPVQPYVPSNLPNGLPANTEISPNYIGSGHTTTAYGDYRNPSVNFQTPAYTGQALNYRPNSQTFNGSYASGNGSSSSMALIVGGGMLGAGAMAVGARSLTSRMGMGGMRGGGRSNYQKDMEESEKRRKKQEEKIQNELKKAHEADLKRKGILPTSASAPSSRPQNMPYGQSNQSNRANQPSYKPGNSEQLEGDVLPASAAQKLDF